MSRSPEWFAAWYQQTKAWYERAAAVTSGGAQTMSKQWARFPAPAFPAVMASAHGAYVEDVDGHRYVDWICGLGAVLLGHNHVVVNRAIAAQLAAGIAFPTASRIEVEASERFLADVAPWAEQVRWVKTGSEACAAAVRIARRITGKTRVISIGYHGWHDGFAAAMPWHDGVPAALESLIVNVEFDNLGAILGAFTPDVAAVILEPVIHELPTTPQYLEQVKRLADDAGALTIFDETITGLRLARGGAAQYYGVHPDLAVYGKGIANGLPLAAIVGLRTIGTGPSAIMAAADVISGTHGGEAASLAAMVATLDEYPMALERLHRAALHFRDRLVGCAHRLGVPLSVVGYPGRWRLLFHEPDAERSLALFVQEAAAAGALFHPGVVFCSAAHDDSVVMEDTMRAVEAALGEVAAARSSGDWSALVGNLPMPALAAMVRG